MRIEILDEAQEDLIQGFRFYESREAGLGAYFLDCLFSDIDSLLLYAGIHHVVYTYHRCLSKRFPFAIYYIQSRRRRDSCARSAGLPQKSIVDQNQIEG